MKNWLKVICISTMVMMSAQLAAEKLHVLDEPVTLQKRQLLELIVGNYVHGFKNFGTSTYFVENKLVIEVYYDAKTQEKVSALLFKRKIEKQMPYLLQRYEWANNTQYEVVVFANGE